ncbi:MAG: diacylglycerol kinase [Rhizobiales bacterium]|nr:diacylglycerol kinase [Hyphomicrobiales bacterium]
MLPLVGLIRNGFSHRNKGQRPEIPQDRNILVASPTTKPELERALADFARKNIGILAISGGDGTIRDVMTCGAPVFGGNWPKIIILPRGKTNALAIDLGLPGKWSLAAALDAAAQGGVTRRHPLLFQRTDADQRDQYGFIMGTGVFNVALEAGQVAHRYGAFQSFAIGVTVCFGILQALFGFGKSRWRRLTNIRIHAEPQGEAIPHSGHGRPDGRFLAGFTTLTRFPLGLGPFTGAPEDAVIHYLAIDAPLRRAVALVPSALFGNDTQYMREIGIQRGSAKGFTASLEEQFILDGEAFPGGDYRVRLGPELQFVVP